MLSWKCEFIQVGQLPAENKSMGLFCVVLFNVSGYDVSLFWIMLAGLKSTFGSITSTRIILFSIIPWLR